MCNVSLNSGKIICEQCQVIAEAAAAKPYPNSFWMLGATVDEGAYCLSGRGRWICPTSLSVHKQPQTGAVAQLLAHGASVDFRFQEAYGRCVQVLRANILFHIAKVLNAKYALLTPFFDEFQASLHSCKLA